MKRTLPLLIASVIFAGAILLMRPEATVPIVAASRDLPAGHRISPEDLEVRQVARSMAPSGVYTDPAAAAGQTLSVARVAGDILYQANMGGEQIVLAKDERAIAIQVSDSAGLAGLLKPGDRVGVTAVIFGTGSGQSAFSKAVSGGFRVLYISPDFLALDPMEAAPPGSDSGSSPGSSFDTGPARSRKNEGTVVLAVPITAEILAYDFAALGVESETRVVNIVDLLPALDHAQNVELSLYLEPDDAKSFTTSGIYLPDLVITPGPSPTPTETVEFPLSETPGVATLAPVQTTPTPVH